VIRWDGHVGAGKVDRRLAMTVDVTTTVVRATGAALGTDGFNLLGRRKRSEVLLEGRTSPRVDGSVPHPAYCGLRSDRYLFVRYADGFEELYDYQDDRYETRNRAADPAYADRLQSMRFTALEGIVPKPPGFTG
jgi:arylsulfatase A-like enzyme